MKKILFKSAVGTCVLGLVTFLAYSGLSAAAVGKMPLDAFESLPAWEPDTGDETGDIRTASPSREVWVDAVRDVLLKIDEMEQKLDAYAAYLDRVEKDQASAHLVETLDLDVRHPAQALETLMSRFGGMVDAYQGLEEEDKSDLVALDAEDKVEALTSVAAANDDFFTYFDGLGGRHEAYVERQKEMEDAAFEAAFTMAMIAQHWGQKALEAHQAEIEAREKAEAEASVVAKARKADPETDEPALEITRDLPESITPLSGNRADGAGETHDPAPPAQEKK